MYEQLEFDFSEPKEKSKNRKYVDYDMLYQMLKQGPITCEDIQRVTGLTDRRSIGQVITTLSIKYPVWNPSRGVYKLCEASDYQTVDWSKLNVE